MAATLDISSLPDFVFVDRPTEMTVLARSGKTILRCKHLLKVSAAEVGTGRAVAITTDPPQLQFADGYAAFSFFLNETASLDSENRPSKYILEMEAVDEFDNVIAKGQTRPLVCVRHRLQILEEQSAKYEFFKDVGGKDKGIELRVALVDASDNPVIRDVAVTPVLLYESGIPVRDQTILQTTDDKNSLVLRYGEAIDLKFRINQVSSKHLNQAFCIQIEPDLERSPQAVDVMPGVSVPVEVRSKIKRPQSDASIVQRQAEQFAKRYRMENLDAVAELAMGGSAQTTALASQLLSCSQEFVESVHQWRHWTHEVAMALETKLKWKPIGYEALPNCKSKTLMYEMQNPNDVIGQLLQQYRDRVGRSMAAAEHVSSLLQEIQRESLDHNLPNYAHSSSIPLSNSPPGAGSLQDEHGFVSNGISLPGPPLHSSTLYPSDIGTVMDEAIYSLGGMRKRSAIPSLETSPSASPG